MSKLIFLFPGQGAQYVGMGKDFYEQFAAARRVFEEADELLKRPFSKLIFEGPQEELTLTKNSQLAIYIVSIAILRTLQELHPELQPSICAGLSLGEYSALTAAQKITFADCLPLVEARGMLMHEASISSPGTMRVVLSLDVETIRAALPADVWVANLNCPGQVVIAGTLPGIEAAAVLLKEKGAKRVLPLDVSGAFHSPLMQSAQERLKPLIERTPFHESSIQVAMNAVGDQVHSLAGIREALIAQVTSPVLWEKTIRALDLLDVSLYVEIGCGKTLKGMNGKIGTKAPTKSIENVTDLMEFAEYATAQK